MYELVIGIGSNLLLNIPLVFFSAIAFYLTAGLLLFPVIRKYLGKVFDSPTPTDNMSLAAIDVFRGMAALWVACFHTWQWLSPNNDEMGKLAIIKLGNKGVPIFVVMSGFLIYRSLRERYTSADLIAYSKRRFLRIYPLYFATICALFFLGYLDFDSRALAEVLMLRAFGYPVFVTPPAWSLYVEVVFYMILPVWMFIFRGSLVAAIVAFGLSCLVIEPREFALIKYFFLGIAAAEVYRRGLIQRSCMLLMIMITGFGLFIADLYFRSRFDVIGSLIGLGRPNDYSITLGIAFCLILIASIQLQFVAKLCVYPLRFLGVISYSIFLWHGFIISANTQLRFNSLGGLSGSAQLNFHGDVTTLFFVYIPSFVFLGALSYAFIERPFYRFR
jgi:peptidoglycan/LPS O-acetylase OafA/YrhL